MHHDNIGWVALEGFHLEHLQTILFAPPGLPAGTHTHTHTHTHKNSVPLDVGLLPLNIPKLKI